jgi:hypothetical protein
MRYAMRRVQNTVVATDKEIFARLKDTIRAFGGSSEDIKMPKTANIVPIITKVSEIPRYR